MGNIIRLRCKKCSYTFDAYLGVGFLYPVVYEETLEEIRKGTYGEAHRLFLEEHKDAAVNCENVLAVCSSCGHPECVKDMTLYLPRTSRKSPEGLKYDHKCSDCGGSMRIFTEDEEVTGIKCPECGDELERDEEQRILWD